MIVDDIRALLIQATDTPVIIANENGPRPALPYIALRTRNERTLPIVEGGIDGGGNQEIAAHQTAGVELQFFGAGGVDALQQLQLALRGRAMLDTTAAARVAFAAFGPVQDMPVKRDGVRWEPRAITELDYRHLLTRTEYVSWIETIRGSASVEQSATSIPDIPFEATVGS